MSVFTPSPREGVFRQGEILSDIVQVHLSLESLTPGAAEVSLEEQLHPHALILTQDCDLDWDFKARASTTIGFDANSDEKETNKRLAKLVPNVLFCELTTVDDLKPRLAGSDILRRIRSNLDERYHFFPSIPASGDCVDKGLPELVADFKRVFSIPTDELYLRLGAGIRRRCIPRSPFLQHLSSRFGYFCLRVALPEDDGLRATPPQVPPSAHAAPTPQKSSVRDCTVQRF